MLTSCPLNFGLSDSYTISGIAITVKFGSPAFVKDLSARCTDQKIIFPTSILLCRIIPIVFLLIPPLILFTKEIHFLLFVPSVMGEFKEAMHFFSSDTDAAAIITHRRLKDSFFPVRSILGAIQEDALPRSDGDVSTFKRTYEHVISCLDKCSLLLLCTRCDMDKINNVIFRNRHEAIDTSGDLLYRHWTGRTFTKRLVQR